MQRARAALLAAVTTLGLVAVIAAVALLVPLGRRGPAPLPASLGGRVAGAVRGEGALLAGAGLAPVRPPPGGPIAGYPAWRRDQGGGTPIAARALALQAGSATVVIASLPVLLVPAALEAEVVRRAALPPSVCLLLAATHTHSGPGGYWDNWLGALGGVGWYAPAREAALAEAGASAIRSALAGLRPARLSVAQADWPQGPAAPRTPFSNDPSLTALQARDEDGRIVATMVDYPMHPTIAPRRGRSLSGDWPEACAQTLEQDTGAPALVLQGAGGDATWPREAGAPEAAIARLGALVAARALALLAGSVPSAESAAPLAAGAPALLACSTRLVALPEPEAGAALPFWLRTAAGSALRLGAPRAALLTTVDLPGLRLVGVPGEPVGELGMRARALSAVPLAIVGLADGYAGYVETPQRARAGQGESIRTWHGPELAGALGLEAAGQ